MGFAGCKKVIKIQVDESLAPLSATPPPGGILEWAAMAPGESFDVIFESGLCIQKSPIHATYEHPAVCTVAPQKFGADKQPIFYTYRFEGNVDGKPLSSPTFKTAVGPHGCPWCIKLR
jgi:hypothetical protein